MSLDLIDIGKLKITQDTADWLESEVRDNPSRSKQEILRDTLHEIAQRALRKARVLVALSAASGNGGDNGGQAREERGTRG